MAEINFTNKSNKTIKLQNGRNDQFRGSSVKLSKKKKKNMRHKCK